MRWGGASGLTDTMQRYSPNDGQPVSDKRLTKREQSDQISMKWIAAVALVIGVASAVEDKDLVESGVRLETYSLEHDSS